MLNQNNNKEIRKKAIEILENGDPVDYIIKAHQKLHIGDEGLAKLLLLSIGSQSVKNSEGLQASVSGGKGKGKTDCCRKLLHLIPEEYVIDASHSDKALFHNKNLKEATIIFIDDIDLTKNLDTTIKRATSNFQDKTIHNKTTGNKTTEMFIPPRVIWWLTSVDEKYSEELLDRMFKIGIDESPEQDDMVYEHQRQIAKLGQRKLPNTNRIRTCREIIKQIKSERLFQIKIPYSNDIDFDNKSNRRSIDMFYDIIRAFTVFNYKQRRTDDKGYLIASVKDYNNAAKFYNKYGVMQSLKLSTREIEICEIILKNNLITMKGIFEKTDLSTSGIRKILKGIEHNLDGLGVFRRYPIPIGGGGKLYQFSLRGFDLDKYLDGRGGVNLKNKGHWIDKELLLE